MFSGIVEDMAIVKNIIKNRAGARLGIKSREVSRDTKIGDSISVSGVCLTVSGITDEVLQFDVIGETLGATTLSELAAGDTVNVERSLKTGDRISGHFVTGHIDCIGVVSCVSKEPDNYTIEIGISEGKTLYLVNKGSVAVDGVSLTVASTKKEWFKVTIIPTTFKMTSLSSKKQGDKVNIELDILAKYASRDSIRSTSRIDSEFLKRHGFA